MAAEPDNPYSAPQIVPSSQTGMMFELLKRAAVGLLLAVIIFQIMVQFNWQLESGPERYRGMMYCCYALLVAMTSFFTQTKKLTKAEGNSGIIPACLLWVVALIGGVVITRIIEIIPYPLDRGTSYTLAMSAKEIGIVTLLDISLVALYARSKHTSYFEDRPHDDIS